MIDIVLDTCTLVHANNSESAYQADSIELITKILNNTTLIIVDEGFNLDESLNNSYIGLEYIKHLSPGMLGYSLILHIAQNSRFKFVSNKVPPASKNQIEQMIRNKKDRMFLRVTINSAEKVLVSHDYTDYQKGKRKELKKKLSVNIVDAADIHTEL